MLSQLLAHRHPGFWPRPDRFDPARFLPGGQRPRPKFAFFPFGGGPRICIGNHMAMLEGPLALAALVAALSVHARAEANRSCPTRRSPCGPNMACN